MEDFASQVVELVYRMASARTPIPDGSCVPDFYDTLNEAVFAFYRKLEQEPTLFATPQDAAYWIFGVVDNMNNWTPPKKEIPLEDQVIPAAPFPLAPEDVEGSAGFDPAVVVHQYFADSAAQHTGRLTLTVEEVAVIQAAAEYGLNDFSKAITSDAYKLIAEILDTPIDRIQDTLYKARATFVEIFYVVGGLGPPGAFESVQTLDAALRIFWGNFHGQNDWSILRFAARSARPKGTYAQVDADHYTDEITREYAKLPQTTPNQAERLRWEPGGPTPPVLLHEIETRVAEVFENPYPKCVIVGCELHQKPEESQ